MREHRQSTSCPLLRPARSIACGAVRVMFRPGFALAHFHKKELMQ